MEQIKVKVNESIEFEIDIQSKIILFRKYKDGCVMTINYPDNWAYSRALQHAMSISECCLDKSKIM